MGRRTLALALALAAPTLVAAGEGARPIRVVFLGDSLTAGYGLRPAWAFPALVGQALRAEGVPVQVVNAGVSGDLAAEGAARLPRYLDPAPDWVFVCLGANDGLRRRSLEKLERDLRGIVAAVRAAGARPAMAGIKLPPRRAPAAYREAFEAVTRRVAEDLDVPLLPWLMVGLPGKPHLFLDPIHPSRAGHRVVAETVTGFLRPLLAR